MRRARWSVVGAAGVLAVIGAGAAPPEPGGAAPPGAVAEGEQARARILAAAWEAVAAGDPVKAVAAIESARAVGADDAALNAERERLLPLAVRGAIVQGRILLAAGEPREVIHLVGPIAAVSANAELKGIIVLAQRMPRPTPPETELALAALRERLVFLDERIGLLERGGRVGGDALPGDAGRTSIRLRSVEDQVSDLVRAVEVIKREVDTQGRAERFSDLVNRAIDDVRRDVESVKRDVQRQEQQISRLQTEVDRLKYK